MVDLSGLDDFAARLRLEAVQTAKMWEPDAAVLDIGMPRLDGYGVARALRAQRPPGPVLIALSGQFTALQRSLASTSVFDACFPKGTDFTVIEAELRQWMANRQAASP